MRLFIGIKLDDLAIKKIKNYYNYFYSENISGNYTDLNNLHLTLAFLGEVNENKLNTLKDIISSLNVNFESIKINKFTKLKNMLIGEIEKEINLITLQKELVIKLKDNGFKIEDRSFYPHITLIRQVMGLKPLKIIDSKLEIESMVNKITLFESTRINGKLTYISKN